MPFSEPFRENENQVGSLPFLSTVKIKIEPLEQDVYSIMAITPTGLIQPPKSLVTKLFYKYENNFFGLKAHVGDKSVRLTTAELVELLSPSYYNPFLKLEGADENTNQYIEQLSQVAKIWDTSEFWHQAVITEEGIQFSGEHADILQSAVKQKLTMLGIEHNAYPSLINYFQDGGWPLSTMNVSQGVSTSIRLREPDDNSDEWVLETVLMNVKTGTVWTPTQKKLTLPITLAIPEKWASLVGHIEKTQEQLIKLLQSSNHEEAKIFEGLTASRFIHIPLNDSEVRYFLQYQLSLLQSLGYDVMLPAWLKELKQSRMKVRVSASGSNTKSVAGLDDILTFKWQFSMNNAEIDAEQFRRLVDEKREFLRVGDEWFRIDADWLIQMKALMEQAEQENWTVRELVFKELPETLAAPLEDDEDDAMRDDPLFAFEIQQSLKAYVDLLSDKKGLPSIAVPLLLQAELRPYQQEGFEWLAFMRTQNFGACLADDMGLGKTVQLITYILYTIEENISSKPSLIICPTSVLGNWQKELERFAPSIKVHTHYGSNRLKDEEFKKLLASEDAPKIVVTTFGTVTQDEAFMQQIDWNVIGLDEAQNIKNMQTQQSRAIRKLHGEHHIALTGTPVENRLSELWAIFDFIHKGYLGSFNKFQEKFITPIERDESEKHKHTLRMKIRPFLLRRTKRDPDLQLNLPEKLETPEFCPLTTEQAALYESYIQDTMATLEEMSPFEKRGHILKMLNKLKQLCNHPALYLKEPLGNSHELLKRSVKLQRIVSMTAEIVENGEQCLIFTQYIGMGNLLQHCFSELYDIDVPFLTGSMPKQQRDRLVESFQAKEFPIFILSLKAGGTGLNLTAANHVLHADRWWNPAVENQATDRAYRIGQKQFVQVHKFVTIGTIEEKIDKMLEMKSALSEELIQSSKWITELQEDELQELLKLG